MSVHPDVPQQAAGNILLVWLRTKLGEAQSRQVLRVYVLIYFALLVEELAVSRLVLRTVFPAHPVITAVLLGTICVVILAYVKWGGFRAVLIADYEQLKLLFPFVLVVAFLVFRTLDETGLARDPLTVLLPGSITTAIWGGCMLTAWIVGSVDFYSRLNYATQTSRVGFATLSLVLAGVVFLIGALSGMFLPEEFSREMTPEGFTRGGARVVNVLGTRMAAAVLFASLFCMIFTTVNTLLITLFQLGYYRPQQRPHIRHIHRVFLWAILLSCAVPANAVSAIGLFFCALMIVPLVIILGASFSALGRLLPQEVWYVWPAIALATITFAFLYDQFLTDYDQMPLLGGLVSACIAMSIGAAHLARAITKARRR